MVKTVTEAHKMLHDLLECGMFSSSAQFSTPLPFPIKRKLTHSSSQFRPTCMECASFPLALFPLSVLAS